MNYFAHGQAFVDHPYRLAGTALPDWLGASNRRARLRRDRLGTGGCPRHRDLACGVARHIEDDAWFHATEAFQRTWLDLTGRLRAAAGQEARFHAWFVAHVLVEMLVDRFLIAADPGRLAGYYEAVDGLDIAWIEQAVRPWLTCPPSGLRQYVEAFRAHRFLYGYLDDDGLFARLQGVARRVGIGALPAPVRGVVPEAARVVQHELDALLKGR